MKTGEFTDRTVKPEILAGFTLQKLIAEKTNQKSLGFNIKSNEHSQYLHHRGKNARIPLEITQ